MKNLVYSVLLALVAFPASATTLGPHKLLASVEVNYYNINSVHLLDDGRLWVEKLNEASVIFLDRKEMAYLDGLVQDLQGVKLETVFVDKTCVFIMAPYSPYLKIYDIDAPEGRRILSPDHCGMSEIFYPTSLDHPDSLDQKALAVELRDYLIHRALEEEGDQLIHPGFDEPLMAM